MRCRKGGSAVSGDVYGMYFTKAAYDRAKLSKEEFALVKEREDKDKKEAERKTKSKKEAAEKTAAAKPASPIAIDWDGLTDRKMRLTINTSAASDWVLSKDGEKLFYLTSFEKGNDLWVTEVRTRETKLFNKLGANAASMELSPDGKFLFVIADGKAVKVDTESGKSEPIPVNTEMVLDYSAEKAYIFDHSWRQFKQKLVFPDLQNVDWDSYYTVYKKFLPHINNNYDFAEMLSEMLGEMNVSHTGCYYRANVPNSDATASLGLLYDYGYTGEGVKVAEVLQGGPVDLAASTIKTGHIIEAIDGNKIDASMDFYKLLNRRAGKFTLLAVYDPASNKRWEETVKPVRRCRRRRAALQALGSAPSSGCREAVRRQNRLSSTSVRTTMRACASSSRRRSD